MENAGGQPGKQAFPALLVEDRAQMLVEGALYVVVVVIITNGRKNCLQREINADLTVMACRCASISVNTVTTVLTAG